MRVKESSRQEIFMISMVGVVVRDAGGVVVGDAGGVTSDGTVGGPEGWACNDTPTDTSATITDSSSSIIAGCGVDAKEDKVSKGLSMAGHHG